LEDDVHDDDVVREDPIVRMVRWIRVADGVDDAKAEAALPIIFPIVDVAFRHLESHTTVRKHPSSPFAVNHEADEDAVCFEVSGDVGEKCVSLNIVVEGDEHGSLVDDQRVDFFEVRMSLAIGAKICDCEPAERWNFELHGFGIDDIDTGPRVGCRVLVSDPGCVKTLAATDVQALHGEVELPGDDGGPLMDDGLPIGISCPAIRGLPAVCILVEVFLGIRGIGHLSSRVKGSVGKIAV